MHNPLNPENGLSGLVDSLIGNAFETVKYVAYYVKEIRYVAFNMEHVYRVSQNMYQNVFKKVSITALDTVYEVSLPEGVTVPMILGTTVTVLTANNEIYGPSDNTFTWFISDNKVKVNVSVNAPVSFLGADLRCLINWQSPVIFTN